MTESGRAVKCVVWDLDNTLWDGVLVEGDDVRLRADAADVIRALDVRGILHSIASRNDSASTLEKLRELGIDEYFVYPQISWRAKSSSVAAIAEMLNISTDAVAFVDDDPFERDEVAAGVPGVLCIDARELGSVLDRPEFVPPVVTDDSRRRRSMVRAEIDRSQTEQVMAPADFLASLGLVLTIAVAGEGDLARVEELTLRTNQLNSTGYTYTYEELETLRHSPAHRLLVVGLDDRYGTYGKVGLALIEQNPDHWLLRVLLISCRVIARGVGSALLTHVLSEAGSAGLPLRAEFIRTDRNRPTYLMFKMAGFREITSQADVRLLEHDLVAIPPLPPYIDVRVVDESSRG